MVKRPNENAIEIELPSEISGGVYANQMVVGHNKEEFVMDFIYAAPPKGRVNARVIVSPGHMKRIIHTLKENLRKYELEYGPIADGRDNEKEMLVQ